MKHSLLTLLLLFSLAASGREVQRIHTAWAFWQGDIDCGAQLTCDETQWQAVSLPHIMQLEPKHCGGNAIYQGIGWYRRHFRLPASFQGKRVVIHLEGVMKNCTMYLNGHLLTEHHGGYVGMTVDLTPHLAWQADNVLAIRVDASDDPLTPPGKPQGRMDFYYYSGIYRDVWLEATSPLYITDPLEEDIVAGGGQRISIPSADRQQAVVEISTHTRNRTSQRQQLTLETVLQDARGRTVKHTATPLTMEAQGQATTQQQLTVAKPHLWHPYSPYLYTLVTRLKSGRKVLDETHQTIGLRTIRYTAQNGLWINGERLYLRGANRHQAYANVGDAASNSMQERDVIALKRGGFNAVRAAHYPHDPAFLDACDRHGLLVVECIPGWQFYNRDSTFIRRLYQVEREMIRRDRNHPSIVLWETALNESRYPVSLARELQEIAHAEMPTDQMYTAGDYLGNEEMEPYYDVFYKQVARYPHDGNVMSNYPEDMLHIKPLLTREWGDGVGIKPRASLTENEEELLRQCTSHMEQLEGKGYFDWCMLDANPYMGGHFVWSYNDYARGVEQETLYCGMVDINRWPKPCYYLLQSMRDASISQPGLYQGPMVHIASWNSGANYTSSTSAITVFSNCDEVRLYRNDQLIGQQRRKDRAHLYPHVTGKGGSPLYVFDAGHYQAGTLRAEALIGGRVVATHQVRTPEAPHHIQIELPHDGIQPVADGSDMIPIYVKICDKNGTLVPDAQHQVSITISGEGQLIGQGDTHAQVSPQQVEGGVGYALIRTTQHAGRIRITASAPGLADGQATLRTTRSHARELPDGTHPHYQGLAPTAIQSADSLLLWQESVLQRTPLPVVHVEATSQQALYPVQHITDHNDQTWWIAGDDRMPQTITLSLEEPRQVEAIRIRFLKDSSTYAHRIETSDDGVHWTPLTTRTCTGWDFKPLPVHRRLRHLRLIITQVSESQPALCGIDLYGEGR